MDEETRQKTKEILKALQPDAHMALEDKDIPIYLELQSMNEKMDEKNKMDMEMHKEMIGYMEDMAKKEMPQPMKVQIEGFDAIQIKGEKGDPGESIVGPRGPKGDKGDSIVGPMGPAGRDGESIVGPAGKDGKDGSPDTPEQVKEKLLEIGLKIEDIEDLQKVLDTMKKGIGGGGFSVNSMNFHLVDDETPAGTIDGNNTEFTIASMPSPVSSLKVYLNGARQRITTDYTLSGRTITFVTAPLTDSILLVDYRN